MTHPKPTAKRLADLRPAATVPCMLCEQPRPKEGARQFHALWVCGPCAAKVAATQKTKVTP
jgi:ribosomal protein L37AE/L43A